MVQSIATQSIGGTKLKWRLLSALMRTAGRTANGIDTGYRHGFDSGTMLDYVYENRASGKHIVGALIDRFYLNSTGWRAIRARKELLKQVLIEEVRRASEHGPVVVADLAAGPGRYLLEVAAQMRDQKPETQLQVICRDLDVRGLELGRARASALGLTNVRYEQGDATDHASLAAIEPEPDVVVVSGLYELFTDAGLIRKSMEGAYKALGPGGRLVFTTQVRHPQLALIANVLVNRDGEPWEMVCRLIEEVEALARGAGFRVVSSRMEPVGLFAVTVCEKGLPLS